VALGAGRDRAEAVIDHGVGIEVVATIGEWVDAGQAVLRVQCDDPARVDAAWPLLDRAVEIGAAAPAPGPLVIERIAAPHESPLFS
jgi:thymidine phosphorylase